jgi:hypothetical protein
VDNGAQWCKGKAGGFERTWSILSGYFGILNATSKSARALLREYTCCLLLLILQII